MLDATGCIGKMYLNADGEIQVSLVQEYEDLEEDFESRYFACDDWPLLLMSVREGIEKGVRYRFALQGGTWDFP